MKITKVQLKQDTNGIKKTSILTALGDIVLLAGSNGSGKTRLLKLLENYINALSTTSETNLTEYQDLSVYISKKQDDENELSTSNVSEISILNYSPYDANLQASDKFPPYVIHKAKDNLIKYESEKSILNSLLYVQDLAKRYSDEFVDGIKYEQFKNEIKDLFNLELSIDEISKEPRLFDMEISAAGLSPGQQYLLRMAVAIHCNIDTGNFVIFLDEPETHLHPELLVKFVEKLREKYNGTQVWIATHSLALISHFASRSDCNSSIFHLEKGEIKPLGSNSSSLINGLLGNEDNRFCLHQLILSPDAFACNKFAIECGEEPGTLPHKKGDNQIYDVQLEIHEGDVVVDYGAGQGRLLEGIGIDYPNVLSGITYYAYDISDKYAEKCKSVIKSYYKGDCNYYNDFSKLNKAVKSRANIVFLVNVLHEIDPNYWVEVFSNARKLLAEKGKLIIVELEELSYGEKPFDDGFLVLTEQSVKSLVKSFNEMTCFRRLRLDGKRERYTLKYIITKELLNINKTCVKSCITALHEETLFRIKQIKKEQNSKNNDLFDIGIRLAFWTHQHANSSLFIKSKRKLKDSG